MDTDDDSEEDILHWHVRQDVAGIPQPHADDCYRTASQMLADAVLGTDRLVFSPQNFDRAGMVNRIGPRQEIRRLLDLDYVIDSDEPFGNIASDRFFRYVLQALQQHGPLLATYRIDPIRPTVWHAVIVMGLATHRGTDQCYFMLRDPDPMKYHSVVAFEFTSFQSKLINLMYSRHYR